MQGVHLRKYGVAATIDFALYEVDGVNFRTDWTPAEGDVFMMRDEEAEEQVTNAVGNADLSTLVTDEGRGYSITLALEDMQAARIVIYLVDQATKAFLDWPIVVETYGNASAQHAFDLDTATQDINVASENNIDFGAAKKTALNAATTDLTAITGDKASYKATGFSTHDAAAVKTAIEAGGSSLAAILEDTGTTLDAFIKDVPTVAEFEARSDVAGTAATAAEVAAAHGTTDGKVDDVKTEVDKIGTIPALDGGAQTIGAAIAKLADDNNGADFDAGTDSLQEIRDRGDAAWAGAPESVSGTLAIETSDTVFNLTATSGTLSDQDDAYNNMIVCILDNSGSVYETARITDYVGASTRITIDHELSFPVDGGVDTFVIYRAAYAPVGAASITEGDKNDIVDKMCDEDVLAAHKTPGTVGSFIRRSGSRY